MTDTAPTVKVKSTAEGHDGYMVINAADYDEKTHGPLYKEPAKAADEPDPDAGRGTKNPDGTFSEPTPTNINYPDKDATEFANNHGAFVGKSAAQMREAKGLPDAPGGIKPAEAARVEEAVAAVVDLAKAEPLTDEQEVDAEAQAKADADKAAKSTKK